MKMTVTREMEDALTTPGFAYTKGLGRRNYELYFREGLIFIKKLVSTYLYDNNITDPDRVKEISVQAQSIENFSFLLDVMEKKYSLKPRVDHAILRNGGLSPRIKSKLFTAFVYAVVLSGQSELINDINEQILKTIQLDFVDPVALLDRKAKDAGFNEGIKQIISIERSGGTENMPLFNAFLVFDGLTVKTISINKKAAKKLLCMKWLEEDGKRKNTSFDMTKTCPRKACVGRVVLIPGGDGKCQKCEEVYHFSLLASN